MTLKTQTTNAQDIFSVPAPSTLFFPLSQLGEGAEEALLPGINGRVLAVFRRSFYIQTAGGDIFCLGPLSLGPGPISALYRFPLEINWQDIGLSEAAPVSFDGRMLQIANRFIFDVFGALKWRPATIGKDRRIEALANGLAMLKKKASCQTPRDSMGYLIPLLLEMKNPKTSPSVTMNAFQRVCFNAAEHLKLWLGTRFAGRNKQHPVGRIKSLVGLGPGLTPSGDDLLGGVFLALHSLGRADVTYQLWERLQPVAQMRTNKISLAHLNWAVRGSGAASVHMAMHSLIENHPEKLSDSLEAVGMIGHTSGWDTLTGIALVWQSYVDSHYLQLGQSEKFAGEKICR